MSPSSDKIHRLKRTTLTKEQLLRNAEALIAFANDEEIQYYSPVLKAWTDCQCVDVEFEHRVKPKEPPHDDQTPPTQSQSAVTKGPTVSTDVNDY